jgi:hypothetical protein
MADDGPQREREYMETLERLLAEGRRGDAAELFMRVAGASEEMIAEARSSQVWPGLEALAHTLAYDAACMGNGQPPTDRPSRITRPTLVLTGGASAESFVGGGGDFSTGPPTPSPLASPVPGGSRSPGRPTSSTPRCWRRCSGGSSRHDLATAH